MPQARITDKSSAAAFFREPLLHFMVLGLLVFLFAQWRATAHDNAARTITVDAELVNYLGNLYKVQFGFEPDAATLEHLIASQIRDEVLFREAVKLGLGQQDEIIRRRMIQKLEYLILDNDVQTEPDDATLQLWYQGHQDAYLQPATASFEHLYFRVENGDLAAAAARAQVLLSQIANDETASAQGDSFPLPLSYTEQSAANVNQTFGLSEFSTAVFSAPPGQWSGPFASGYGLHLLKVNARSSASPPAFADIREQLASDWREADRQQRFEKRLAEMQANYSVVRSQ